METMQDPVFISSPDYKVIYMNPATDKNLLFDSRSIKKLEA